MRFSLILELKNNIVPIEYRSIILSYIKNAILKSNGGKYYDNFFKGIEQKKYCFSVIFPKSKFDKDNIILKENKIEIFFTADNDDKTGFILYSAFISQKNNIFMLPNGNCMILKNIINKSSKEITNNRAIFKTTLGSGICVRDHNRKTNKDTYYVYNDEEFREKLGLVIYNQLIKLGFSRSDIENVKVNPIQCKKVVVKHYKRYIDITTGIFEIKANKKILQYFYDAGIGSRKSMGFGMIDLVTEDLL